MPKPHLNIRLLSDNKIAMGPGKADLLDAIIQLGSISAAAKSMHMSYRRAWELVDVMNNAFQEPLVTSSPGGAHGGGAAVTDFGLHILKNYRALVSKAHLAASLELDTLTQSLKTSE